MFYFDALKCALHKTNEYICCDCFIAIIRVALAGMDREMREEYLVVIQAKDMGGHMGGLSGTTTVTVTLTDINDNPPKFTKGKMEPPYKVYNMNYSTVQKGFHSYLFLAHSDLLVTSCCIHILIMICNPRNL